MQLTKHTHACVTLAKDDARIVIDPGTFTPEAAQAVATADAVLITHEHFDHVDADVIERALEARPELRVYGPASVVDRWSARRGQVTAVTAGDTFAVAGFDVSVFGDVHAAIHRDIPRVANAAYLVDGVYHPGDSYHVPDAPVSTLLLPTSGPWTKLGEAVDFVRDVAPTQLVQIHEVMLSEVGQQSTARILSPEMLSKVPLTILPPGETIAV
ncbi:MAG: MBL fold metallo-hydrolase [Streptomyces sp.]|nr:MBL fold metallo-hydrolase [Streptomyces sp.]